MVSFIGSPMIFMDEQEVALGCVEAAMGVSLYSNAHNVANTPLTLKKTGEQVRATPRPPHTPSLFCVFTL